MIYGLGETLLPLQRTSTQLAPGQQLALRVLALGVAELRGRLADAAETNPFLEVAWGAEVPPGWEDVPKRPVPEAAEENFAPVAEDSLEEHLLRQARLERWTDRERRIAYRIIESLDERGYLRGSPEEIARALDVSEAEVMAVLAVVHTWDPPGIAARTVKECLLLQLDRTQPVDALAARLLEGDWRVLATADAERIARQLDVTPEYAQAVLRRLKRLRLHPARALAPDVQHVGWWDLEMRTSPEGEPVVQLSEAASCKVHVRAEQARRLLVRETDPAVRQFLQGQLQEARWWAQAVQQRHRTLVAVAQVVVCCQERYLYRERKTRVALTLADVARAVGIHVSTVSRALRDKWILTPRGLLPLSALLTRHTRRGEGNLSEDDVRDRIERLIRNESAADPLSDEEIRRRLADEGIWLARRTVTKYRTRLGFPAREQRRAWGPKGS